MKYNGTFTSHGDDAQQYLVHIFVDEIPAGPLANPNATIEGLHELRTSDGLAVNRLRGGEYQVVRTGVVLRSDSPEAP